MPFNNYKPVDVSRSQQAVYSAWNRRAFLGSMFAASGIPLSSSRMRSWVDHQISKSMTEQSEKLPAAAGMATAAQNLLGALNSSQRDKILFALEDERRQDWHYTPRPRIGLPLKELDARQQQQAQLLLSAGLSRHGHQKARTIISLEPILREIEQGQGPVRDPGLYFFTIFGQPQGQRAWGWRVEGHHLSLNYTLSGEGHIASTPSFFGANPAEVRHGEHQGLRTLAVEEDMGRLLLKSLDDAQRRLAVVSASAPRDILSGNARRADPLEPVGIQVGKMSEQQTKILVDLLQAYVASMPEDIALARMTRLRAAGLRSISFAWAGGGELGEPHYYRVQGPTFLIEYDNTQNKANHIHTVWRDFEDDFGRDLLAEHYKSGHRKP